jgi:hypothetical protein
MGNRGVKITEQAYDLVEKLRMQEIELAKKSGDTTLQFAIENMGRGAYISFLIRRVSHKGISVLEGGE